MHQFGVIKKCLEWSYNSTPPMRLYGFDRKTLHFYLYCRLEYDPIRSRKQRFRFCSYFLFEAVLTVEIDESLSFENT